MRLVLEKEVLTGVKPYPPLTRSDSQEELDPVARRKQVPAPCMDELDFAEMFVEVKDDIQSAVVISMRVRIDVPFSGFE